MNFLISIFIFLVVLFLYLHITYQYKRSEDLEIYELDFITNQQLQEVCNVKQPILFNFKQGHETLFNHLKTQISKLSGQTEMIIKDTNDYYKEKDDKKLDNHDVIDVVYLSYDITMKLMKNDANSHLFKENNYELTEESIVLLKDMDEFIKPPLMVQTKYDFCMGSKNCGTPLRYHTQFRQFYMVSSGKISVKMTPFKYSKYLYPNKDYDIYEFRSPINVWKPQENYLNDMDKISFLEFDVLEGHVLYVPPYWWYSIKYVADDSSVLGFTYDSFMNVLANTPDYMKYLLQQQNTKTKLSSTLEKKTGEEKKMEEEEKIADVEKDVNKSETI